jgi:two-component sensor histidine kinase
MSLAKLSLSQHSSLEEFRTHFLGQISAMARAHEALAHHYAEGVDLHAVFDRLFAPFTKTDRKNIVLCGDNLIAPPRMVQPLALVLYELATNAVKHGSLSIPEGRVELTWRREGTRLRLHWLEMGGPTVKPPTRRGMGTELIEGLVEHDLDGLYTCEFKPTGIDCRLDLALHG